MKQTIGYYQFIRAFEDAGRTSNFSRDGLSTLFDYLENLEDDIGEEIELDVVAICCEYSEESPEDIADNYGIDISECEDEDEARDAVLEYLENNTSVCGDGEGRNIVYAQF